MKISHLIITGLFSFPLFLHSQPDAFRFVPRTAADSNRASLGFGRNINTYSWNFLGNFLKRDSLLSFRLNDQFTSSLINSNFISFRDENTFGLSMSHDLSEQFTLIGQTQSYILSDNQSLDITKAGIHSIVGGVSYRPVSTAYVIPMGGIRYDLQQGKTDEGFNYNFLFGMDSIDESGYRASFNGQLNQSDLHPRRFGNNNVQGVIGTDFSESSSDSVQVRWYNNRWDFYIPADSVIQKTYGVSSNIRSRIEQAYGLKNYLLYSAGDGFSFQLSTTLDSRTIDNKFRYKNLKDLNAVQFNTTVQQFTIGGGGAINYFSRRLYSSLGLDISERDEKHIVESIDGIDQNIQQQNARQESKLDNTGFQTTLKNSTIAFLSSSDTLHFNGSVGLFRYDTPDTLNTDDRDEQSITMSLTNTHWFSPVFSLSLTAEATLTHIVYIYKDKSANNNWNRIFRLSPELTYVPSNRFRMYTMFEVLANYTVFDFEALIPTVQSYSYRQVAFLDSTSYDISEKLGIDVIGHVRMFERGELHWDNFTERPQQYIEEVTFSPQLRYRFRDHLYFAAGFRSFAQKVYNYNGTQRVYQSTFLSAGPTTHIVVSLSPRSLIDITGWKEFQQQSGQKLRDFSNVTLNIRYFF